MSRPAVINNTALSPTSRLTSRLRKRNPPRPSVLLRLPDFSASIGAVQALRNAGSTPKATPATSEMPRLSTLIPTLAVPVRDSAGHYVAGINVILQGRLVPRAEMAERYYAPLHHASLELGSLLLP